MSQLETPNKVSRLSWSRKDLCVYGHLSFVLLFIIKKHIINCELGIRPDFIEFRKSVECAPSIESLISITKKLKKFIRDNKAELCKKDQIAHIQLCHLERAAWKFNKENEENYREFWELLFREVIIAEGNSPSEI